MYYNFLKNRNTFTKIESLDEDDVRTLSLKLPSELEIQLERTARKYRRTKSEIVREAIELYLQRERPVTALELADDLVGGAEGPSDLSTNADYLSGLGE